MRHPAYSELPAARVLAACQAYLADRNARIEAKRSRLIDALMARRWFRPTSRDEARDRLKRGDLFEPYHLATIYGGYQATIVNEVQALAAMSSTVFLSSEAAEILADYFDAPTPIAKEA